MKLFHPAETQSTVGVVVITGSCCIPGLAPIEQKARQILDQIIAETGVSARVKTMSVIQAMSGGIPKEILNEGMALFQQEDRPPLPAILINGKPVSRGFPDPAAIRSALLQASAAIIYKENQNHPEDPA